MSDIKVYECDNCKKLHKHPESEMIFADDIVFGDLRFRDMCFCNEECLCEWIKRSKNTDVVNEV